MKDKGRVLDNGSVESISVLHRKKKKKVKIKKRVLELLLLARQEVLNTNESS